MYEHMHLAQVLCAVYNPVGGGCTVFGRTLLLGMLIHHRCVSHLWSRAAVVGVFPDGDATEEAAEFKAAAQAMRDDFEFGLVTDASMVPEAKKCVPRICLLAC